jgi:phospholipase A-2-activating protein
MTLFNESHELMADNESSEVMFHPCQTVWTVGQLDNGDVITGGSDGNVRIWTRHESRYATADVREVS